MVHGAKPVNSQLTHVLSYIFDQANMVWPYFGGYSYHQWFQLLSMVIVKKTEKRKHACLSSHMVTISIYFHIDVHHRNNRKYTGIHLKGVNLVNRSDPMSLDWHHAPYGYNYFPKVKSIFISLLDWCGTILCGGYAKLWDWQTNSWTICITKHTNIWTLYLID